MSQAGDGNETSTSFASRARALAESLSGVESSRAVSPLEQLLRGPTPAPAVLELPAAPPGGGRWSDVLPCKAQAAAAAREMASFARVVSTSALSRPDAQVLRDLQERFGINVPGMLDRAASTLSKLSPMEDAGMDVTACWRSSVVARQVQEVLTSLPRPPAWSGAIGEAQALCSPLSRLSRWPGDDRSCAAR